MSDQDFGRSVGRHLDAGTDELAPSILHRLRAARDAALAQAREGSAGGHWSQQISRHLLTPFILALIVVGVLFWQQERLQIGPVHHSDFADVDTEVLTGDLPVVAYLDPGFEIWLYHHRHHSPAIAED